MPGLTETVARFIAESGVKDAPAAAVEKSKKALADTFAVILAGSGSEVAPPLLRYLEQAGGSGNSPILGSSRLTSPEIAALINGAFGHALDYDDVLSIMPGHPSAIMLAAVLANTGRLPISGRQLLEAHIIGIEVGARIGVAITVGHYDRGFHGTGTLGIFAAVAALAKLHQLDARAIQTAFGIACSMASGLRRNFGTMTKPLHTGWAARSALVAVELARCGFTAAPDIFEAKAGFFAAYGVDASNPALARETLGRPWVIVEPGITLKKFPCCFASHRAVDGILRLREKMGLTAETLARLECRMPPGGMQVLTYPTPTTGLEAKFSLQYPLAACVLDGTCALSTFADAAVVRPVIRQLLERIECKEDPRCGGNDPLMKTRASGSRGFVEVEVRMTDGRSDVIRVDEAPGRPSRELSWQDIARKFADCAAYASIDQGRADHALQMLTRLEDCDNMGNVIEALVKR